MPKNSKSNIYKTQQLEIKNKLLDILEISDSRKFFTLYEIDNNVEKKTLILGLEKECETYFATSTWTYFKYKRDGKEGDRPYLLIIRNLLSATNTQFLNKVTTITIKNIKYSTTKYIII